MKTVSAVSRMRWRVPAAFSLLLSNVLVSIDGPGSRKYETSV